ncbi:FRAS1-related extracellular matrix protein 1 [Corchorus capsularis]|uniref:FRAS1-related extracellular matrix protein 1 n=1 Tax=Corchorus capsularis TaxID=210143 RepID=A0A1R3IN51_COCAP|nr:FRAS1-related extracellular matrix protein 1 [Corchorus capsularis]
MSEEIIVEIPGTNRMSRRRDFTILTLCMLVRAGQINPFLNSCFATQIYVNLPINETAMVAAIYEDINGRIEMMPPANQPPDHPPQ